MFPMAVVVLVVMPLPLLMLSAAVPVAKPRSNRVVVVDIINAREIMVVFIIVEDE